jgi:PAS domain S-box-containing protein
MKEKSGMPALMDSESLSEMLNDCSIDRVMAIDKDWNIIAWNRTSEITSGIARQDLLGKNLLIVFPQIRQDNEMMNAINDAFEGRKSFLPSNSSTFNRTYSENHFIPLNGQDGEVVGVMNIMHDVAHRIKVEKQLRRLNTELEKKIYQLEKANRELATFTQVTSQDIKEPLKHVYTSLELLIKKEGQQLSNMSKGNLRRMQGSLNKMNLLLDDILTVSGLSNSDEELGDIDLNELVAEVIQNLQKKIEEKNALIKSDKLPRITGYPKMIRLLFQSLMDNAIKFHGEDRQPVVRISAQEVDSYESGIKDNSEDSSYWKISVVDNGIGFDQAEEERIFQMFERLGGRDYHGSGIGLTLCKKIVEAHDGIIRAISSPGSGARFDVYLPIRIS